MTREHSVKIAYLTAQILLKITSTSVIIFCVLDVLKIFISLNRQGLGVFPLAIAAVLTLGVAKFGLNLLFVPLFGKSENLLKDTLAILLGATILIFGYRICLTLLLPLILKLLH